MAGEPGRQSDAVRVRRLERAVGSGRVLGGSRDGRALPQAAAERGGPDHGGTEKEGTTFHGDVSLT